MVSGEFRLFFIVCFDRFGVRGRDCEVSWGTVWVRGRDRGWCFWDSVGLRGKLNFNRYQ